jgi:hypothetical protein
VRVTLQDARARDFIAGKGKMLADYIKQDGTPTAGMKMDVPDYLASDYSALDDIGFKLKKKHGKETRKYIRYDDEEYSLYLEVRLPGTSNWLRISPKQARELRETQDAQDLQRATESLGRQEVGIWNRPPPTSSLSASVYHPRPLGEPRNSNLVPLSARSSATSSRLASVRSVSLSSTPVKSSHAERRRQTWNPL